jgi:hypothetical protein
MTKTKMTEYKVCDICKEGNAYHKCLSCGKDICYDCKKEWSKEYIHSLFFSGSDDGLYCNECDQKLSITWEDKLHNAYVEMEALKQKYNIQYGKTKTESDRLTAFIEQHRRNK